MINDKPDTRSIGVGTRPQIPEIRSAKTGELLGTSQKAQAEVNMLLDSQEKKKPRFNSEYFKPPRQLIKNDFKNDVEEG